MVCDMSVTEVLGNLWSTIEKGLIIPLGESYKLLKTGMGTNGKQFFFKFQHDRVHEAAYTMIPEQDRPASHLKIARILCNKSSGVEREKAIIEIVRHYNLGAELITDPSERIETCRLNYMASVKARKSVAYETCLH
jgi:predicted ATPase